MTALIGFFVRRPVTTSMLFSGLCLMGLISLGFIPLALMPPTDNPAITIITRYPGVSPAKIEEVLTKPIEEQVLASGAIEDLYSTSEEGESRVNVTFVPGVDITRKTLDVRARINLIRDGFPREVEEPTILRYDPTDRPVWIAKLESSTYSLKELRDIAENKLKKRLERIEGVSEIKIGGGFERQINVDIDQGKLNVLGIRLSDFLQRIAAANVDLPAGAVYEDHGRRRMNVRVAGKFTLVEAIEDVTVAVPSENRLVRVKDLAHVRDGYKDIEDISRENGSEIVSVYVHKAGDANTIAVCDGLQAELDGFQLDGLEQDVTYNQAKFIRQSVDRVRNSALTGGLIAVVILFMFLRSYRATFIVAVSIPLSIVITFLVMFAGGVSLHIMTLSGLALGIGMLIDNSIVVLESIFAMRDERGFDSELPVIATRRVAPAVLASTLTNVAVFFPIFFGSFEIQRLYGGLSIVVVSALLVSLAVSLFCSPVLMHALFRRDADLGPDPAPFPSRLRRLGQAGKDHLARTLVWGVQLVRIDPKYLDLEILRRKYIHLLIYVLRRRGRLFWILGAFAVTAIFMGRSLKQEYIDPLDTGEIRANVELETGTHLEATDRIVQEIEDVLRSVPEVESVQARVEKWHADIYIKLVPPQDRSVSATEMIDVFKSQTDDISGAFVYYVESGAGADGRELDVEFIGDDMETLKAIARRAAAITREIDGVQESVLRFREGKDELRLFFDRGKAALTGVSAAEFGQSMKTAVQGTIPTKFLDEEGREVDVKVRFRRQDREQLDQVYDYLIPGQEAQVPVRNLVRSDQGEGDSKIYRKNKRKMAAITVKLGSLDLGTAATLIRERLKRELDLPVNYYFELGGNLKKLEENRIEMLAMVLLAVFLVYGILASLFESRSYPLIIILSIPVAACGVIWTLFVFRMSVNISVYIGAVMLAGIVVNNAIILVDSIRRRMPKGRRSLRFPVFSFYRIIADACSRRIRPILMTTLSTLLAMTPMILDRGEGSQLWRPLAVTVVSGLSFSTVLTLLIVPAFYAALDDWRGNFGARVKKVRRRLRGR